MPGVNLSQPMEEESSEKRSFFDAGILLSFGVLLLVGLTWGGIRFYLSSLDKKIVAIESTLQVNAAQTKGAGVDRVVDFDARLHYFFENKNEFDTQDILKRLEDTMVSGVTLTDFKYDTSERVIAISGKCDDFRKLADQMFSFKSEKVFSQVRVEKIDRDEDNRIEFTFKADF